MSVAIERERIIEEVRRIPDERLGEAYALLRRLHQGAKDTNAPRTQVMGYAGSWNEMPDEIFSQFLGDVTDRRQQAFSSR